MFSIRLCSILEGCLSAIKTLTRLGPRHKVPFELPGTIEGR
jgi:hypothetical protein